MIDRASAALLEADLGKAESVIAQDEDVDQLNIELEERATQLLALQQPVATDLRIVTGALRMSSTIERMGDLARHIAKIARMRYPDERGAGPGPADLHRDGAGGVDRWPSGSVTSSPTRTSTWPCEIEQLDDRMDELHRPAPADPAVRLGRHRRPGRRPHPDEPLLRAVRRPRREHGPPDRLHDDRHEVRRARKELTVVRPSVSGALGGDGGDRVSGCVRVEVLPAADGRHAGRRPACRRAGCRSGC